MTPLTDEQKQLVFDHSLGVTSEHETAEAERLLASSREAAQLHLSFKAALSPLDSLEPELCPDEISERTIQRLVEQAQADLAPGRLEELLAAERSRGVTLRIPFLRNWGEVAAVAAVIVLILSGLFPAVGMMRQKQWQARCGQRLGGIHNGISSYVADHDGLLPAVPVTPGAPWWKVGYQGQENHSNTRRAWLLVKNRYVEPSLFACPARRLSRKVDFDSLEVEQYNDFPGRAYIHFSVRVCCPKTTQRGLVAKRVLMADLNPLSERFPEDHSSSLSIELCQELMSSNSRNHDSRGQNLLLCDGSVEYVRVRRSSISEDDIYTLQAMSCGSKVDGREYPSCETDTFLAP